MVDQTARESGQDVDRALVAREFAERMSGKLDQEKIDAGVRALTAEGTTHSGNLTVASLIFWIRVTVTDDDTNRSFLGNAGGISSPGGGGGWGTIWATDDNFDRLYGATTGFEINMAVAYTSVVFFDDDGWTLGHIQTGSFSTAAGIAYGSGTWS